ncbi:hypothetical protein AS4_32500 [Acinetobacter guillouiae]|nr:hypothetical protein AS4_32500 [Acinetobacter guillouiae]
MSYYFQYLYLKHFKARTEFTICQLFHSASIFSQLCMAFV